MGWMCLSVCLAGDIPSMFLRGGRGRSLYLAKRLKNMFGKFGDITFMDWQRSASIRFLIKLARELQIEMVVTNDSHYVNREDSKAQDYSHVHSDGGAILMREGCSRRTSFYIKSETKCALFPTLKGGRKYGKDSGKCNVGTGIRTYTPARIRCTRRLYP